MSPCVAVAVVSRGWLTGRNSIATFLRGRLSTVTTIWRTMLSGTRNCEITWHRTRSRAIHAIRIALVERRQRLDVRGYRDRVADGGSVPPAAPVRAGAGRSLPVAQAQPVYCNSKQLPADPAPPRRQIPRSPFLNDSSASVSVFHIARQPGDWLAWLATVLPAQTGGRVSPAPPVR